MAAAVTFLPLLEPKPNTAILVARPVCSIQAASCSRPLGLATVALMSCLLGAAAYWRTLGTTASQTSNSVTCQDTWWSSPKTSMDPGDWNMLCFVLPFKAFCLRGNTNLFCFFNSFYLNIYVCVFFVCVFTLYWIHHSYINLYFILLDLFSRN